MLVFVEAGRLADEHQVGARVAHAEDDLLPPERVQLAARAVPDVIADSLQRVGSGRVYPNLLNRLNPLNRFNRFNRFSRFVDGMRAFPPLAIDTHAIDTEFPEELQVGFELILHMRASDFGLRASGVGRRFVEKPASS